MPSAFLVAFNYSTTLSGLQCQVVEQLYSPLALRQSVDERHTRASRLMVALEEALNERQLAASTVPQEPVFGGIQVLFEESDAVMHHSTAYEHHSGSQCGQLADFGRFSALIQHATMSATTSDSPALGSARRALRLNVDAWKNHKHLPDFVWSGHCHWTLLKAPITPFTVTFCHIIAHPFMADADLGLLVDYVATLKDLRRFSDGMIKMYRLCDVFCKVATLYVHAKINEAKQGGKIQYHDTPAWIGQPAVNDIDGYLSTIGFAPPPPGGIEGGPDMFGGNEDFDASFLLDWYEGNNSLMGFLEQDLTFPGDLGYGDVA
ncbi:putative pyridoxal kinase [Friedmanniomyces endolithicus]|nr:putative pyridoxal kinase [Friedmanniomyces endolithicus]